MTPQEKVAANVRAELARKGVKKFQFAELLEISQQAGRLKLNGSTSINIEELGIIAKYLDVTIEKLIEGAKGYAKDVSPFESAT